MFHEIYFHSSYFPMRDIKGEDTQTRYFNSWKTFMREIVIERAEKRKATKAGVSFVLDFCKSRSRKILKEAKHLRQIYVHFSYMGICKSLLDWELSAS